MTGISVVNLTCEYRENPMGIDEKNPRMSWQLQSDRRATDQQAYQIQVAVTKDFHQSIWDTGKVESDQSIQVRYTGPIQSRTTYFYRVKVWDHFNRESEWSQVASWETAFLEKGEWTASWITPDDTQIDPQSELIYQMRKSFCLEKEILSARLYATAAGLYEAHINGQEITKDLLTPGWTSYKTRLQYQTYDVTEFLCKGENAIGVRLADGWYKGNLGWSNKRNIFGDRRAWFMQLHVQYGDGTEEVIRTDSTWKASTGPILSSELYHGETYDARLEQPGWTRSGFDDSNWGGCVSLDLPISHLIAQENWPTRVTETLRPIDVFVTLAGDTVIDMGQNMVGRIRFQVEAPKGTVITLEHAEVLDKDRNIYFGNLRKAKQRVTYITKGEGVESFAPHFTFQGFRYVKVEGYPNQENGLNLDHFIGEVIHSDMPVTGEFTCSDLLVNQLQKNIVWGQRGNFVDVPTDCPQRDERLGWTGDAQVFIRTALFNYQGAPFFKKWLRDLKADQLEDGGVPFVIPDLPNLMGGNSSSAAWGDAATVCPWTVYTVYGDNSVLEEQYDSMKAWVEYIRKQGDSETLWNTGFHFGDWLGLDAKENSYIGATPKDFIATAFYAHSTRILRNSAIVLEKYEDAAKYSTLLKKIKETFVREFISPTGRLVSPTQTAHVLALTFDLVEGDIRSRVASDLNDLVIENNYHLTTGFVGTPYLSFALSENGYHDTAVKLLLQDTYPSWLYSIKKGATTIWEHWDSIKPDDSFWSDDMNSFNHYAYGAIGDWMYRRVAGLDMDENGVAYKKIVIRPLFAGGKLTAARAEHQSMYGKIVSSWEMNKDEISVRVIIPANTTASIRLPHVHSNDIKETNIEVAHAEGVVDVQDIAGDVHIEVRSGEYTFTYPNQLESLDLFSKESRVLDLLSSDEAMAVLEKNSPGISEKIGPFSHMKTYTLNRFAKESTIQLNDLDSIIQEINQAIVAKKKENDHEYSKA
jgi:alpha-L-rhamnosidase